jgi:S1-C subfamily serine protease
MELAEAIAAVGPAVVQVQSAEGNVSGTGFFLDEEAHVVTAFHVVDGLADVAVWVATPNSDNARANFVGCAAVIVAEDPVHDLAILRLQQNPFRGEMRFAEEGDLVCATATLAPGRPTDGEPIAISGYPLGYPVLITTAGAIASAWAHETVEAPVNDDPEAPEDFTMSEVLDLYVADVQANGGNSGGPAYKVRTGEVIGVCIQTQLAPTHNPEDPEGIPELWADAGLTVIRPARYVSDLASSVGIS